MIYTVLTIATVLYKASLLRYVWMSPMTTAPISIDSSQSRSTAV